MARHGQVVRHVHGPTTVILIDVLIYHVMLASRSAIILVNLCVRCPLAVNVQRLQHVLHVLELLGFQRFAYAVDHVVISLLLLLLHLRKLLKVLLPTTRASPERYHHQSMSS